MNLVKTINQFDANCLFLCDPIKNNVMNEGNFIRLIYSTPIISFNGVYLFVQLHDVVCEKYYNKYKCLFNINTHQELIGYLEYVEKSILSCYETTKIPSMKIHEQLRSGYIKLFTDIGAKSNCSFVLKISGIWETQTNYGLTYKFVKIV